MSTNYHAPMIAIISYLELYRDRSGLSRSSRRHWQRYSASCPNTAEMFANLTVAIENSVSTGKSSETRHRPYSCYYLTELVEKIRDVDRNEETAISISN
jgi:hypothetical protein